MAADHIAELHRQLRVHCEMMGVGLPGGEDVVRWHAQRRPNLFLATGKTVWAKRATVETI